MRSLSGAKTLDVMRVRQDFPVLARETRKGVPLVYLDSAATAQKPRTVIDAMTNFYETQNANIHRGIHRLAEEATEAHEAARKRVADFIGAASSREIIFTRNTTESINLVVFSWGRSNLHSGDCILLTEMEHHSNSVPWMLLAEELGLRLEFVPITGEGLLDLEAYARLLELEPRMVGFTHMSNVLGTINPVKKMTEMAHEAGALVLIDGAQSVPHFAVDISDVGADFMAFSAHKMCGPTGIGVLYGREALLESMPPFLGGGDMIKRVSLREFKANDPPYKFEAGTPAIAEAIGFGAAIDYLDELGMDAVHAHEQQLIGYALERLAEVPGLQQYGPDAEKRGGVVAFTFNGIHPHDLAQILDDVGVAVRAGHHCAMPLHESLSIPATTRASFYIYNTIEEIDALIGGLHKAKGVFG